MKLGRELDALVAEKVMGKRVPEHGCIPLHYRLPYYSIDIAAAWDALSAIVDRGWVVARINGYKCPRDQVQKWSVFIEGAGQGQPSFHGDSETAPHAICLAALKAVGAL